MENKVQDLIKKYDISGPRYTSYPPAPMFSKTFGPGDYTSAILRSQEEENYEISLYVHLPFCDTLCYFCGCTTIITRNVDQIGIYLQYLKKEIDLLLPLLNSKHSVVQMHWGGGTPTYLSPAQIVDLGTYIRKAFNFDVNAEISVEVDPRELTFDHLKALREVGFNRISLGVQDFDEKVQRAVNRNQSEFVSRQAIEWSRTLGFSSVNLDLIYGLPLQSVGTFSNTLDKIIGISPERIAVYNFAYVPWIKKHQKLIHMEDLPSPEEKIEILTTTINKLSEAQYVYVGMDHFAKPNDELTVAQRTRTLHRNFQGYSTKAGSDLFGLGMSAIGHFGNTYSQNQKTLQEYYQAIGAGTFATHAGYSMTFDDRIRKFVIMRLMCDLMLNKAEIDNRFGIDFDEYFADALKKLQPLMEDGLLSSASSYITITTEGRLFLRNIAMCFDAYISTSAPHQQLYSKTV